MNKEKKEEPFAYHIEGHTAGGSWRNEFTKSKMVAEKAAMENWTVRVLYVKEIFKQSCALYEN